MKISHEVALDPQEYVQMMMQARAGQGQNVPPLPMAPSGSIRPSVIPYQQAAPPSPNPMYQHMQDMMGPSPITPGQFGKPLSEGDPQELIARLVSENGNR